MNSAVGTSDGFVKNVVDRIGAILKVVVCEFSSHASMTAAVTNEKAIISMGGLWLSLDTLLEHRLKYQRLFKVKRGNIEAMKRPGDEIALINHHVKSSRSLATISSRSAMSH